VKTYTTDWEKTKQTEKEQAEVNKEVKI